MNVLVHVEQVKFAWRPYCAGLVVELIVRELLDLGQPRWGLAVALCSTACQHCQSPPQPSGLLYNQFCWPADMSNMASSSCKLSELFHI
jgi:hypothetical protein